MLRIRLREHHQLYIIWIPAKRNKALKQIVNLIIRQRQPPLQIGLQQCIPPTLQHINTAIWLRRRMRKHLLQRLSGRHKS